MDIKGASVQLGFTSALTNISAELVEADFTSRSRLADSISNWTSTQAIIESLEASYEEQFLDKVPAYFVEHIEALRSLSSSLLSEVKLKELRSFLRLGRHAERSFFLEALPTLGLISNENPLLFLLYCLSKVSWTPFCLN